MNMSYVKQLFNNKRIKFVGVTASLAGLFVVGALAGYEFAWRKFYTGPLIRQLRASEKLTQQFSFINPLLSCEVPGAQIIPEFKDLQKQIEKIISDYNKKGDVISASVYFDTRDGRWLGINLNERYFPASLLKVPTMIAFLKVAENHPEILSKKIVYNGKTNISTDQYFKPKKNLTVGDTYSIEELLERMIKYSDNNTLWPLLENIDLKEIGEVYTDLGLFLPTTTTQALQDFMPVKRYARFFRVLYNASYLNRAMSEKALSWLGQSTFDKGLAAGVPLGIPIAHKFGERGLLPENFAPGVELFKELHDCGIIYHPQQHYLLCVMTKGNDLQKLTPIIDDISKVVYQYIDKKLVQR